MSDFTKSPSQISASREQDSLLIHLSGDYSLHSESVLSPTLLKQIASDKTIRALQFNCSELGHWDSLLLTELIKILDSAQQNRLKIDKTGLPTPIQGLLKLVSANPVHTDPKPTPTSKSWLKQLRLTQQSLQESVQNSLIFLGEVLLSALNTLRGKNHFQHQDFWLYIQECGPGALPIVTLISLLVGLILAFVGAVELSLFGAQIYIANLVCLGMTREMGGLMTAVIMAGRTGAAYAAQLGTMQLNNEIDALKTMNLEPVSFLVLPRLLALILIMPLLCLYADLMGIIGGGLVTVNLFEVSVTEYLDRTLHAVHLKDFLVGFIKSSVFGVLIALSGCMRGIQCGRSASAVGDAATSAVVTSIVSIVIADSIMTIICNRLGI
jgi:phospholipid/cholesterol/gamma-HCH transport system permease protein